MTLSLLSVAFNCSRRHSVKTLSAALDAEYAGRTAAGITARSLLSSLLEERQESESQRNEAGVINRHFFIEFLQIDRLGCRDVVMTLYTGVEEEAVDVWGFPDYPTKSLNQS